MPRAHVIKSKVTILNRLQLRAILNAQGDGTTSLIIELEERADGFSMVDSANSLSEDGTDIQDFEFRAELLVNILWDTVGDNDFVQSGGIDASNSIATEDSVG